jgi:hypothetical protein
MVFNVTFDNISVVSWWSVLVLLVEETGENYRPNVVSSTPSNAWVGFELTTRMVIGTDCIGSVVNPTTFV